METTALQRNLAAGAATITAEVMPPRGGDVSHTLAMAEALRGRVHAINVTDGSRAVMLMSSLAVCRLLLDARLEPVLRWLAVIATGSVCRLICSVPMLGIRNRSVSPVIPFGPGSARSSAGESLSPCGCCARSRPLTAARTL